MVKVRRVGRRHWKMVEVEVEVELRSRVDVVVELSCGERVTEAEGRCRFYALREQRQHGPGLCQETVR